MKISDRATSYVFIPSSFFSSCDWIAGTKPGYGATRSLRLGTATRARSGPLWRSTECAECAIIDGHEKINAERGRSRTVLEARRFPPSRMVEPSVSLCLSVCLSVSFSLAGRFHKTALSQCRETIALAISRGRCICMRRIGNAKPRRVVRYDRFVDFANVQNCQTLILAERTFYTFNAR